MGSVCGALVAGIGLAIALTLLIERCQYIYCFRFNHKYIFVHFFPMQHQRTKPQQLLKQVSFILGVLMKFSNESNYIH